MSRIRSIHPDIWTDENFVALSPLARLFLIGIWNECDDHGVFVWSPLQLKMRLLPMEGGDPNKWLFELVDAGFVLAFSSAGKQYGAVKNFMRFQRPNKPKFKHPLSKEIARFVGCEDAEGIEGITEPLPNHSRTTPEPVSLGEEGRGGEEELAPNGACASGDAPELRPEHVQERWNVVAKRIGRPCIRDLTPERRQLVRARIAQYAIDDFVAVFGKIEASPFLRGERKWSGATFDWTMKKGNFQKILEGNYDEEPAGYR